MCAGMTTMVVGTCIFIVMFNLLALEMFWVTIQLNIIKRPGRLTGQKTNYYKNVY